MNAWMIINRNGQITIIEKKKTFTNLKIITVIDRREQIFSSRWKVDLHYNHLNPNLEYHCNLVF